MIRQQELETLVLHTLYEYYQNNTEKLEIEQICSLLEFDVPMGRIQMALETLRASELVEITQVIVSGQKVYFWLSEKGYKYAEELDNRAESSQNPLGALEAEMAPAAGRIVSFSDNQNARDQAIACLDDANDAIRSSNTLDIEVKQGATASLDAWRGALDKSRAFAISTFKFLVWDRLKAVIEGGIEEVYRAVLVGLMITLATIVLSLS